MKPKIKICGITNIEDAMLAESLGADFIGLIFAHQSPRHLSILQAIEISRKLTTARPVGVFVEQTYEGTLEIADAVKLWGIQHYSYFPQSFVNYTYIYASRLGAPDTPEDFASLNFDYLLLDSYEKNKHGGTGHSFDWSQIPELDRARIILAGGLGSHNICAAARENVFALDLSSSVEAHPGKKSPKKLKTLFSTLQSCLD